MEKNEILLSVIVPVYNGADVVSNLTDSVLKIKRDDLELILIDDGSTDDTPAVCRKIAEADPRCKVLRQENRGVSAARNAGLEVARGEYIYFCDCDDEVIPETLEQGMELVEKTGYDVYLFDYFYRFVKEERRPVRQQFEIPKDQKLNRQQIVYLLLAPLFLKAGTGFASLWNKIYSAKLIRKNGLRFEEKVGKGEDWRFLLDCLDVAETGYYLPEVLYIYNLDGSQTEKKYKKIPGAHLLGANVRKLTLSSKYNFDFPDRRKYRIYQSLLSEVAYSAANGCEKREILDMMRNPTVKKAAQKLRALKKDECLEYGILKRDRLRAFCILHRNRFLLSVLEKKINRLGE